MKAIVNVLVLAGMILLISSAAMAGTIYWTPAHELAPQGHGSKMVAGDLDGDGDCDISMLGIGPVAHYWNVGTPQEPAWALDETQYSGIIGCYYRAGGLGDVDGDGDLDLAIGCYYEDAVYFYWNMGPPEAPVWQADPSVLGDIMKPIDDAEPRFGDMDADGDLDLMIIRGSGRVWYAQNVGSSSEPVFEDIGWVDGIPWASGAGSSIGLGDLDSDGDLDLVRVSYDTWPECFENVGTPQEFGFVENPSMLVGVSLYPNTGAWGMDLLDIDGDGDPDMILAVGLGYENLLFLNGGATPVEPTSWSVIKAMYR